MKYQNKGIPYLKALHPGAGRRLHTQNFLSEYTIPIGAEYTPEQLGAVDPLPEEIVDHYGNVWKLYEGEAKPYPKVQPIGYDSKTQAWGSQTRISHPPESNFKTHPASMWTLSQNGHIIPTDEEVPKGI